MQDELISPFPSENNQYQYLTLSGKPVLDVESTLAKQIENGIVQLTNILNFRIRVELGSEISIEQRVRYTCWDLLGDVGGFNDGLIFVCEALIGAYSGLQFSMAYSNGRLIDNGSNQSGKDYQRKNDRASKRASVNIQDKQLEAHRQVVRDLEEDKFGTDKKLDSSKIKVISWALNKGKAIQVTLSGYLREVICFRKGKQRTYLQTMES